MGPMSTLLEWIYDKMKEVEIEELNSSEHCISLSPSKTNSRIEFLKKDLVLLESQRERGLHLLIPPNGISGQT